MQEEVGRHLDTPEWNTTSRITESLSYVRINIATVLLSRANYTSLRLGTAFKRYTALYWFINPIPWAGII